MPGHSPFGQLGSAPVTPVSGPAQVPNLPPAQPFSYEMPSTARRGSWGELFGVPSEEEVRGGNLAAFRQAVLGAMDQGQDVSAAVMGVLNSSVGAAAMNDPSFPTNNKEFIKLISPEPEGTIKKSEVTESFFNERMGADSTLSPQQAEFLGVGGPDTPERILIIDEIMKEKDPKRRKLLQRLIPRDAVNKISTMDALRLRVAGVEVDEDLSFPGVNKLSPEQATTALRAGMDERSATDNDLVLAALAPEDTPERKQARLALDVKVTMKAKEMDGLMALIAARDAGIAGAIRAKPPQSLDELWEIVDGKAGDKGGKKKLEVPIAGQKAPQEGGEGDAGRVVAPPAAPAIGSEAGTAPGPRLDVEGVFDAIQSLSPEDMQALKEKLATGQSQK